jgi:hypothetical protein
MNREQSLMDLMRFVLDVPTLEGTIIEQRVKTLAQESAEKGAHYKLKNTSGNISKNAHMYTSEQMEYLKTELKDFNLFFGYTNNPHGENQAAFFDYESDLSPEEVARYGQY